MAVFMIMAVYIVATISSAAAYCAADNDETYSYHGSTNDPPKWPQLFPPCNGQKQSPIDIQTNNVRKDQHREKLRFYGYDTAVTHSEVVNNGHTVMITPEDNVERGITVEGSHFDLQQLHFHWGSEKNPGAEHTLNGRRYPLEAHFVHSSSDNRTAVVGVLIQVVKKDNQDFKPIIDILSDVQYKDDSTELRSKLSLIKLLPESTPSYYEYTGSLTTPMCAEGVMWFVLKNMQSIGSNQLKSFLKIYSVEKQDRNSKCLLAPNNRPIQDANGRVVYESE